MEKADTGAQIHVVTAAALQNFQRGMQGAVIRTPACLHMSCLGVFDSDSWRWRRIFLNLSE